MTGVYVTVPVACFRKGLAREYLETEEIPPPSTCYGFLLSLVGEVDRKQHIGSRVSVAVIARPDRSVVLRTIWRVKNMPLGAAGNTRPDYQELLSGVSLVVWVDSGNEIAAGERLEDRVKMVLDARQRGAVRRFGGLSFGESTHLVNDVACFEPDAELIGRMLIASEKGRLTLPVWVDHVGSLGTRYVNCDVVERGLTAPAVDELPRVVPLR
ncbi:MAG: type I-MYXAN CRISPR-associated protein Cas5/Cmx5/DevS [Sedimentisphaerales bacterium]|nr:type I-MYXAN CRISPR-associated protein Cas5/Cmx5/DevS [Sedimentisphaerales bacterium]